MLSTIVKLWTSAVNMVINKRLIGTKLTGFLFMLSLTVNAYLLLHIGAKPVKIPNTYTLQQKNAAFLHKRDVQAIKDSKSSGDNKGLEEEIAHVNEPVNFEIKKERNNIKPEKNEIKQEIKEFKHENKVENIETKKQKADAKPVKKEIKPNVANNEVCSDISKWTTHLVKPKTSTNLADWTFKSKRKCPRFTVDEHPKTRSKVSLQCNGKDSKLVTSDASSSRDIEQVVFGDECLRDVIDSCCRGKKIVPNVVHYIWYADKELGYFQFISFMSVLRFMKPCLILIHGPYVPKGKYWDYFISISPNVVHVLRDKPTHVFGKKLAYPEHASDVMRIEALIAYGGVYLDFDEIILRSVEPLRNYDYTQGRERDVTMGSQFVMARRNATFLNLWYLSYRDDYKKEWAWNALWVPEKLSKKHPELIHVDGYNFTRPNWQKVNLIFKHNYDWSTNYGMHMYVRWYKNVTNNVVIRTLNTTVGAVCRHVLFGNKELCVN